MKLNKAYFFDIFLFTLEKLENVIAWRGRMISKWKRKQQ